MAQYDRLLSHLKSGRSISPMEAWSELGIYRLAARVNDLRARGHNIERTLVETKNRWGEVCRYAEYRLH